MGAEVLRPELWQQKVKQVIVCLYYCDSDHNEVLWFVASLEPQDTYLDLPISYTLLHLTSFIFKILKYNSFTFQKKN